MLSVNEQMVQQHADTDTTRACYSLARTTTPQQQPLRVTSAGQQFAAEPAKLSPAPEPTSLIFTSSRQHTHHLSMHSLCVRGCPAWQPGCVVAFVLSLMPTDGKRGLIGAKVSGALDNEFTHQHSVV